MSPPSTYTPRSPPLWPDGVLGEIGRPEAGVAAAARADPAWRSHPSAVVREFALAVLGMGRKELKMSAPHPTGTGLITFSLDPGCCNSPAVTATLGLGLDAGVGTRWEVLSVTSPDLKLPVGPREAITPGTSLDVGTSGGADVHVAAGYLATGDCGAFVTYQHARSDGTSAHVPLAASPNLNACYGSVNSPKDLSGMVFASTVTSGGVKGQGFAWTFDPTGRVDLPAMLQEGHAIAMEPVMLRRVASGRPVLPRRSSPCSASVLNAEKEDMGAGMGTAYFRVDLVNVSNHWCWLQGYPHLAIGSSPPQRTSGLPGRWGWSHLPAARGWPKVFIPPAGSAEFVIASADACTHEPERHVSVAVGGQEISVGTFSFCQLHGRLQYMASRIHLPTAVR